MLKGSCCVVLNCGKRKRRLKTDGNKTDKFRSDSDGSEDDESPVKRVQPRTFHRFPTDEDTKKQWLVNLHREDWVPSRTAIICSDHIKESDIRREGKRVTLKKGALPTRFKGRAKHPRLDDDDDGMRWEARESKEMEVDSEIDKNESVDEHDEAEDIGPVEDLDHINATKNKVNDLVFS